MQFYKEEPPLKLSRYDIEFFKVNIEKIHFSITAHVHSTIEFLYINEDKFQILINGDLHEAHKGDLVIIRSNAIHSIFHPNNCHGDYYVLKITSQHMLDIFKGAEDNECLLSFLRIKKDDPIVFKSTELPDNIKNIWKTMIDEYNSKREMMILAEKAYASSFIISMYRDVLKYKCEKCDTYVKADMISQIYDIMEYVNLNYSSNISAIDCAKKINLSYSHFAKLFRAVSGKSFKEYLTDIRMAKAKNILLATELSITDVALSCGYNSHAHFTAEFKKYYGKTPTDVRNPTMQTQ